VPNDRRLQVIVNKIHGAGGHLVRVRGGSKEELSAAGRVSISSLLTNPEFLREGPRRGLHAPAIASLSAPMTHPRPFSRCLYRPLSLIEAPVLSTNA